MVSTEEKNPVKGKIATITDWHSIDWKRAERQVGILQKKVSNAYEAKQYRKAKRLQYTLANSFYAKAVAVRTVTSNKGKNTPGVDGQKWNSPKQKFQALKSLNQGKYHAHPLRRVYIPKKSGKVRPLGIPTFFDRGMQKLYALTLEPVSELHADNYSYGFRKYRSAHDASQRLFNLLASKNGATWIIDADIKGCFDNISHEWILEHIPLPKTTLTEWLKCGLMDQNCFQETDKGTPQGGLISPMLANYVLDGICEYIHQYLKLDNEGKYSSKSLNDAEGNRIRLYAKRKKSAKIRVVRYADDIIISAAHREETPYILKAVQNFLALRGLETNNEKTKVVSIEEGFDFLGWNYRKYKGKLLVKPSKSSIRELKRKIKDVFIRHLGSTQKVLIQHLNPIIRGWSNYHKHNVSKSTFTLLDNYIWQRTQRWGKRRHLNRGIRWINRKYFHRKNEVQWIFTDGKVTLKRMQGVRIWRHTLIKGDANYFKDKDYFLKRTATKALNKKLENPKIRYLFFRDNQICAYCKAKIEDNLFDIHHLISRKVDYSWQNQLLLHRNCHHTLHAKKERIKRLSDGNYQILLA